MGARGLHENDASPCFNVIFRENFVVVKRYSGPSFLFLPISLSFYRVYTIVVKQVGQPGENLHHVLDPVEVV